MTYKIRQLELELDKAKENNQIKVDVATALIEVENTSLKQTLEDMCKYVIDFVRKFEVISHE